MERWLETTTKEAVKKCAHATCDSYKFVLCVQDPNESFPAFIQLFSSYWDEIMDSDMGQDDKLAVSMFM